MSAGFDTRLAAWFRDRYWRVVTERTGTVDVLGVPIAYDHGSFEVESPGTFVTPLGHRGRRGFLVVEITSGDGIDITGSEQAFGEATLRRAQEMFGTIRGLPQNDSPVPQNDASVSTGESLTASDKRASGVHRVRASDSGMAEDETG